MSAGFAVDLALLDEAIERLARFEQHLTSSLEQVSRRTDGLHACWAGAAAAEQATAHREWAAGAQRMHEALVTMRRAASAAHGNYASAVQANLSMWA